MSSQRVQRNSSKVLSSVSFNSPGFTVFDGEDVPGRAFQEGAFGGLRDGPMSVLATAVTPTVCPSAFIDHIRGDSRAQVQLETVEVGGRLEIENAAQHGFDGGAHSVRGADPEKAGASCLKAK